MFDAPPPTMSGGLVEMHSWVVAVTFAGLPVSTLLGLSSPTPV